MPTPGFSCSNDWHVPFGFPVVQALNTFEAILGYATSMDTGFIVLEHDMWPQTVDIAVGYVLPYVRFRFS